MQEAELRFQVKNFRAINSADIALDGITVIAGENGSGKSTISKLLYNTIKTSLELEEIIEKGAINTLSQILWGLANISRDLEIFSPKEFFEFSSVVRRLEDERSDEGILTQSANLLGSIDLLSEQLASKNHPVLSRKMKNRSKWLLEHIIRNDKISSQDITLEQVLDLTKDRIRQLHEDSEVLKIHRPLKYWEERIRAVFPENDSDAELDLWEFDTAILDKEKRLIQNLVSISNVAYFDTPMAIGLSKVNEMKHWSDLNKLLSTEKTRANSNRFSPNVFLDILSGEAEFEQKEFYKPAFVFKRKDGKEFNLLDCATGLKSFSILQILYKNGFLSNKTLLLIDEPEAHLHPQWVVEYARLVVLLNKHLGVRFLIASHHPDMISAIRYISEKEEVLGGLNFYLTEQVGETYKYDFKHLGTEIEEIFASFNIALDRIDQYGPNN